MESQCACPLIEGLAGDQVTVPHGVTMGPMALWFLSEPRQAQVPDLLEDGLCLLLVWNWLLFSVSG